MSERNTRAGRGGGGGRPRCLEGIGVVGRATAHCATATIGSHAPSAKRLTLVWCSWGTVAVGRGVAVGQVAGVWLGCWLWGGCGVAVGGSGGRLWGRCGGGHARRFTSSFVTSVALRQVSFTGPAAAAASKTRHDSAAHSVPPLPLPARGRSGARRTPVRRGARLRWAAPRERRWRARCCRRIGACAAPPWPWRRRRASRT
jgi:hypothetical protein